MFNITPITSEKQTDCGATCLKMLLNYYDINVDLDTLIKDCNTGIRGCSAKDILNSARKHGLIDIHAYNTTPESLIIQDRPAIIWWLYNHFVVFCGQDENGKIIICNPDRGLYRLSFDRFKSFYCGVALTNGEAEDLPQTEQATIADYQQALVDLGVNINE